MDTIITFLNTTGKSFVGFSSSMLIQSSLLIILLLVLDAFLRKKVRLVFLYGIWMLLLVKLVMPTTFSSPTGLVYWIGDKVPGFITEAVSIPEKIASFIQKIKPMSETITSETEIFILPLTGISPGPIAETSAQLTVEASPATEPVSWQGFTLLAWLIVVTAMLLLLIRRMFFVRGLLAKSKNPSDSMVETLNRCRKQMGVHRTIFLRISRVAAGPSVCGLFRPTIIIPQNLLSRLKREDLRTILLHELAHIKRSDLCVSLIQTILQIVYFYNPLLWVANVIIRKVREQAVDEMVLVAMGEKAEDYPQSLLNISRMTFSRPALKLRLIGVSESKKALERRIINMLNRPVPKSSKLGICGLIAIVVIGAVILPMHYDEPTALAASVEEGRSTGGIIVPGRRVGQYTFDMTKDDVLEKLGKPKAIFYGDQRYTLDDLPRKYFMHFGDVSFHIVDDSVKGITALSPDYKFANGVRVGDPEQKVKEAFGNDFHIREFERKDFLSYKDKGLMFEINTKDRTVMEINVSPIKSLKPYKKAPGADNIIIPGRRVGQFTFDMTKDDVLEKLGKPKAIFYGDKRYTLDNLPRRYFMSYGYISFGMKDGLVKGITALSPSYKFPNGVRVGDSEQKVKEAFGDDFEIEETKWKDYLSYKDKGLMFEINKKDRTVMEINVSPIPGSESYKKVPGAENIIIPGLRVGEYTFNMTKDDVLERLGKPEVIFYGDNQYTIDNLPGHYYMCFGDISFRIHNDSVKEITVISPSYRLPNGLRVGDSEQKIKEVFGNDFHIREFEPRDFLSYRDKGLMFEIQKKDRTILEINVSPIPGSKSHKKAPGADNIIIPGMRVGEYTFNMTKQDILESLGKPRAIFYGDNRYTLDDLPEKYFMLFDDISFGIVDDSIKGIGVHSPLYKFTNGLGVGDSEKKIKEAFGEDFHFKETKWKDFLTYEDHGLQFEINKKDRTVIELSIFKKKPILRKE